MKVHVFAGGLDWVDVGEGNVPAAALGYEGVVRLSPGPLLSPLHHTQDIKLMRKIIENKLCNCTSTAAGPCCCRGYGGCEAPRLRPGAAEESEWLLKEYFRSAAWRGTGR